MRNHDNRMAPWLPGKTRMEAYEEMARLAKRGLSQRQIAECLGTKMRVLNCYMWRQGITMAELRGQEDA